MSIEYADSIRPVTKLIPHQNNYVTNSVFRSVHYYNGNSFFISLIQLFGESFNLGTELLNSCELALGHRFIPSRLDRMRNVGDVASAGALPTELRSRILGNPRISRATWAIAK
jgi:hypothetical protein